MAEPAPVITTAVGPLEVPLIRYASRTPPPIRKRQSSMEERGKLVRFNTLPEFITLSEEINRQAPSHFGWFDQKEGMSKFREKITKLAEDKQKEVQLQQVEMIDKLDEQSKVSAKEKFIKTVQKVINVNTFFSQIQKSFEEKEQSYPRRSSFNGISQYTRTPHLSKMAEIIHATKRKNWYQRIWDSIKTLRGILSLPITKIENLVESRFGSAAVSYFVLLKRIILLNFIITIFSIFIWFPAILPCPTVARNSSNNQTEYVSTCNKPVYNRIDGIVPQDRFSFLTLQGLDNTSLFLGSYRENGRWDYKSAYFYTFFISTFTILVFISYMLGQAYIDTFSLLNSTRNISLYIANIVFGGWTYSLTNTFSVSSEHKRLNIVLKETVWECSPNYQSQRRFLFGLVDRLLPTSRDGVKNFVYVFCLWLWRAVIWAITLTLLMMGAVLIVITALQRVCKTENISLSFIFSFIPSLWHTVLELLFSILTAAEFYSTQSQALISLLIKHLLMRLISLCSIFTVVTFIYSLSQCQGHSNIQFPLCFESSNATTVECLASGCWETEVAKLFHGYLVAQFISSILIRSLMITLQNFVRIGVTQLIKRSCFRRIPGIIKDLIKNFFSTPFHLPKHVIKVVYIQSLVWSGMLFCPYQHLIGFVGFTLLYFSMFAFSMWNCRISSKQPRTARSNLVYYLILFSTFFFIMVVAHFPLFQFVPSLNCGPFSGYNYYYEFYKTIHLKWISDLFSFNTAGKNCTSSFSSACPGRLTLIDINFWDSPAVGPLTVITVGILLIYFATLKKKNYEIVQLRRQILLLAIDRIFYVESNAHFLSALSQKYLKNKKAQAAYVASSKEGVLKEGAAQLTTNSL